MSEQWSRGQDPLDDDDAWLKTLMRSCEPQDDGFSRRVLQSLPCGPQVSALGALNGPSGIGGLRLHDLLDPIIWHLYVWTSLAMMAAWWLSSGISSWMSVWMAQDTLSGVIR